MKNSAKEVNRDQDLERLRKIPGPLVQWYRENARKLPWRDAPSPYRVWVSEIMLQQTRIEAGKPYFLRFVEQLPDFSSLAEAEDETLMKLWEGLGYYSRVRNMKKAAQIIVEKYGGNMPADYAAILSLPGVGEYTAGAVASIAFGIPVPAVDGNVLRVLSRILASDANILQDKVKKRFRELLEQVIPADCPGDFNQALMELGALVCIPGKARCEECPARKFCLARERGITELLPVKAKAKPRRIEERTVVLLIRQGRVALQKRPETGLLAGLWEFPSAEGKLPGEEVQQWAEAQGLSLKMWKTLPPAKHVFSHIEWHMVGILAVLKPDSPEGSFTWVGPEELAGEYALPSAFRAFTELALKILQSPNEV